jgi:hypothetical protein
MTMGAAYTIADILLVHVSSRAIASLLPRDHEPTMTFQRKWPSVPDFNSKCSSIEARVDLLYAEILQITARRLKKALSLVAYPGSLHNQI